MSQTSRRTHSLYWVGVGAPTAITDSDTATGTDTESSLAVAITDPDTATGADGNEALAVAVTDTDTSAADDVGESIAATFNDADTASGADTDVSIDIGITDDDDPATFTETASILTVASKYEVRTNGTVRNKWRTGQLVRG